MGNIITNRLFGKITLQMPFPLNTLGTSGTRDNLKNTATQIFAEAFLNRSHTVVKPKPQALNVVMSGSSGNFAGFYSTAAQLFTTAIFNRATIGTQIFARAFLSKHNPDETAFAC